ncbi:MAG: glycerol-3-phosphate 1-O-acyltransferase PlsY [Ruminococcaceae bacterium]|nr:glycerol-3-phosphate 1-O-acyltransferase PlsY [Oscillospiraceae bacterium]
MLIKIGYSLLVILVAYCCGNFNGAIITSRTQYHSDVRDMGSGNAGLTNFYRCYGAAKLSLVAAIDMGKAFIAVFSGGIIMRTLGMEDFGQALAMLFVISGHMFPLAYEFKGGKGVLSAFGAMLVINWQLTLILFMVFILLVALFRYSSLGSITAAALMPIGMLFSTDNIPVLVLLTVSAGLVIFMHRGNIGRLLHGTESKLTFSKK